MKASMLAFWQRVRASYWFLPSLMTVAAITLSLLTGYADRQLGGSWLTEIPFLYLSQTSGARAILTTLAGSMIGVAGVTFSMTIVSVSFASAQFGPRLVGNFMRDTGNQFTLGMFIGTFVYCLMVLRTVHDSNGDEVSAYVPHFSILTALLLALASVAVLIHFFHHIPESINVSNITAQVGRQLRDDLNARFPDLDGDHGVENFLADSRPTRSEMIRAIAVSADTAGYVQSVDIPRLVELACEHDVVIRSQYRPGDFAITEDVLLHAWPEHAVSNELVESLRSCYAFGMSRTPDQDILFLVDELVEIMARALSPGVNDPFTAVSCIDWLHVGLNTISGKGTQDVCHRDEDGTLRLITYGVDFERFASRVFHQSRQYVAADRNAALRMMKMLVEVAAYTDRSERRALLIDYCEELVAAVDQVMPLVEDRTLIRSRYEQGRALVDDTNYRALLRDNQGWLGGRA